MPVRPDTLTAESVDSGTAPGVALYETLTGAVLELGSGTVETRATNTGNTEVIVSAPTVLLEPGEEPPAGARLTLRNHPTADGPAAELRSPGDVNLTPADGYKVRVPRLAVDVFEPLKTATPIVMTNPAGEARYTFPTPYPVGCFGATVGSAGTFGHSYTVSYLGADAAGVNVKIGRSDGSVLAGTSLLISVTAVGR